MITTRTHARARQAILLEFENAPETGRVLLVTWSAYSLLPYVDRKNWTVFIDEMPPLEKAINYKLPRNSQMLLDRLVFSDCEFQVITHPSPPPDQAEAAPVGAARTAWMASSGLRPLRRPVATTERMSA